MTKLTEFVKMHRRRLTAVLCAHAEGKMSYQKLYALIRKWEEAAARRKVK